MPISLSDRERIARSPIGVNPNRYRFTATHFTSASKPECASSDTPMQVHA